MAVTNHRCGAGEVPVSWMDQQVIFAGCIAFPQRGEGEVACTARTPQLLHVHVHRPVYPYTYTHVLNHAMMQLDLSMVPPWPSMFHASGERGATSARCVDAPRCTAAGAHPQHTTEETGSGTGFPRRIMRMRARGIPPHTRRTTQPAFPS
jgi:hypothetical protein